MQNINIRSAWGVPTNEGFNPETSGNGGGYWQYAGGIVAKVGGKLVVVEVDDASCGDFGSRIYVSIACDGYEWRVNIGTMDDAGIDPPEEADAIFASISGVLGIDADTLIAAAEDAANLCAWRTQQDYKEAEAS